MLRELAAQGIYPDDADAKCYTTDMLRTEQTFSLIYGEREHEAFPPLRELDFGDFEMKSYDELKDDPDYQTWINDTTETLPPPGGESTCDFRARVLEGFTELLRNQEEWAENLLQKKLNVKPLTIVVCHSGPIAEILQNEFPNEKENFYQWLPDPGHGYLLTAEDGKIVEKESF